ncbi:MAG: right-handed parallel beta-helix repeat-containing protein [Muribaculaceae bacterium]
MRAKCIMLVLSVLSLLNLNAQVIYMAPDGNDSWPGTSEQPVASFAKAQQLARSYPADRDVKVILADGVYYLPHTVCFTPDDSKEYPAKLTICAQNEGKAVISGGKLLKLKWKKEAKGLYSAKVDGDVAIDQLYVDGVRQQMARFPNVTPGAGKNVFDTWELSHSATPDAAADPLNQQRIASWKNPENGFVHAMHEYLWGDMHWVITGKNADNSLQLVGGWQNNRPSNMHPVFRMVENIKEELDTAGEWFHDKAEKKLYYMPMPGMDMAKVRVEVVCLNHLMEFNGSKANPVKGIHLQGLVFKHSNRTFMDNKEPLLRSDWTIYRGGAVVYNGAEDCTVESCEFNQVGGNTIFVNNYNKNITIKGCYIHHSGANGIAFVGDPDAVRSPLFRYGNQDYGHIDTKSGPKTDNYPQECTVEDCLITMTGRDEKQTAPIQISMSYRIRVSHCSIYDVPRAGINISEGTFGGHVIEHCDIFNTVLETGDHGSFNSWGRDRYWTPDVAAFSRKVAEMPDMHWLDMVEPNVLRNNRWRCDHGWDVDLDDGSSHYRIYNNLLLNGGLKLREGYDRIVTNNIIVNNSLHPHVWPKESGDVFKCNIVFDAYQPAVMQAALGADEKWGKELDYNLFVASEAKRTAFVANGADVHSQTGNPEFVDAAGGDFRVSENSAAWKLGFHNFDMNQVGVRSKKLKAIAKTPVIPAVRIELDTDAAEELSKEWLGATLKEAKGDRLSAFGVGFDKAGIAIESVAQQSQAARMGLRNGDLLQSVNGIRVTDFKTFFNCIEQETAIKSLELIREQQSVTIKVE